MLKKSNPTRFSNDSFGTLPPDATNMHSLLFKNKQSHSKIPKNLYQKASHSVSKIPLKTIPKTSSLSKLKPLLKEQLVNPLSLKKTKIFAAENSPQKMTHQYSNKSFNFETFKNSKENLIPLEISFTKEVPSQNANMVTNQLNSFENQMELFNKVYENQEKQQREFLNFQTMMSDLRQKMALKEKENETLRIQISDFKQKFQENMLQTKKLNQEIISQKQTQEPTQEILSKHHFSVLQKQQEDFQTKIENEKLRNQIEILIIENKKLKEILIQRDDLITNSQSECINLKEEGNLLCQLVHLLKSELKQLKRTNEDVLGFIQKI